MADPARIEALEQQLQDLQTQLTRQAQQSAQQQTQIANQTTQLTQQAALLAQQAAQPIVPPPVQPGPFALTPALANQNIIDLSSTKGIKLYKSITTPLDIKFDGSSKELVLFMDELKHKADENGWNDMLLRVSDRHPVNPTFRNLITNHRLIDIEDVRAHAQTYIGTQARVAQDSNMMYIFIRDSLSKGARSKMATEHVQYDINGTPDGPCYLKALLVTYFVETIATNYVLRQKLQALPDAMKRLKFDVSSFNSYVNQLTLNLTSGGETSNDMMVYLFTAYEKVEDASFQTYIAHKKEAYDEGSITLTPLSLMALALAKYNLLQSQTKWLKKTKDEEQLVALTAQLKEAKAKLQSLSKASSAPTSTTTPHNGKHKGKLKLEPWYYENPDGLETMTKDDRTLFWCSFEKRWGNHGTARCYKKRAHDKQVAADKAHSTPSKGKQKDKKDKAKALTLAKALIAINSGGDQQESISNDDSS